MKRRKGKGIWCEVSRWIEKLNVGIASRWIRWVCLRCAWRDLLASPAAISTSSLDARSRLPPLHNPLHPTHLPLYTSPPSFSTTFSPILYAFLPSFFSSPARALTHPNNTLMTSPCVFIFFYHPCKPLKALSDVNPACWDMHC